MCVKIPKVTNIKGTDHRILNVSLFELEHLAKARYDNAINDEVASNNSMEIVSDPLENDILQFVNLDSRLRLQQFRDKFNNEHELDFYTDGALSAIGSVDMKMGLGWIQTRPEVITASFVASYVSHPSSTIVEIAAMLSALLVAPDFCHVNIYTDSANLITLFYN